MPPDTAIVHAPRSRIAGTTTSYRFRSSEPGSKFLCKLDARPWSSCRPPRLLYGLDPGRHRFKVAAVDRAGNTDPSPAVDRFRVNG
jgi:hypothetical protein